MSENELGKTKGQAATRDWLFPSMNARTADAMAEERRKRNFPISGNSVAQPPWKGGAAAAAGGSRAYCRCI